MKLKRGIGELGMTMTRVILACLFLAGCSSIIGESPRMPEAAPPDTQVVTQGLKKAALEAKLVGPLEVTALRPAGPLAPNAPGVFMACVRNASPAQPQYPYAVFFKDNTYSSVRMSLQIDDCYAQTYRPL
jgi:hypothetical protein